MEQDLTFFDTNGLTSTSANHIANLAKEYVQAQTQELENVEFFNSYLTIIGSDKEQRVQHGWDKEQMQGIADRLRSISLANSLIAWLREAIKLRSKMLSDLHDMEMEDYCKEKKIDMPEQPFMETLMTREEQIATLSVKDRARILSLEAKAAAFGKFIHPDGHLSEARKEYMKIMCQEAEIDGSGRDTLLYRHEPSVELKDLEGCFFALQGEYRKAQAELNGYNHSIDEALREDEERKRGEYNIKNADYLVEMAKLEKDFTVYKDTEQKRISRLKIVIPNDLREIYETVTGLGKEEE